MKITSLLTYTACSMSLFGCNKTALPSYETKVTVHVVTENGEPVPGSKIRVVHDYTNETKDSVVIANTDAQGIAITSAKSLATIWVQTSNPDYYPTHESEICNLENPQDYTYAPAKHLEHKIVVRKIIKSIPLYAKQNDIPIPQNDKWIGFDFEIADWVKPYGDGVESDVEFFLNNEFLDPESINGKSEKSRVEEIVAIHTQHPRNKASYLESRDKFYNLKSGTSTYEEALCFRLYEWKGTLKMRVPHVKGGILAEKEKYLIYSKSPQTDYARDPVPEMRMPHHAPKDGYQKEYQWEKTSAEQLTIDEKLGFFIKTRVKLDDQGNEISAHYAKFITDVQIDIRGRIKFTSYFNPTANDTNLEFDLKKNLFKELKDLEKPYLP